MTTLTSWKPDTRMQKIISDRGALHNDKPAEGYKILNVYTLNKRNLKNMRQKPTELKRKIDEVTIYSGDTNMPLSASDGNTRQKFSKNREVNTTVKQ